MREEGENNVMATRIVEPGGLWVDGATREPVRRNIEGVLDAHGVVDGLQRPIGRLMFFVGMSDANM